VFVIELIYKADLAAIDAQMRAHMAFLKTVAPRVSHGGCES
jgi:hypothetical protein